uniref:Prenylcysteine lyase domain-containing protein n=1 Tax=Hanusia phi TaxID=3032 RepID=A0A7S0DX81_9CRYP|mmetsp:Transcript_10397/g.23776  ORF Transcript_10397/g.23776 Transcript_10397/m.23776 type:complete len:519 (+) Transcript_10397:63-1619(+)
MLAYERQRFARHLCISAFFLLLLAVSWAQLEEEGNESSTSDERLGKVAVVGSGIGGASSSYFLRRLVGSEVEVHVFEAEGRVGGRCKALKHTVSNGKEKLFEVGASIIFDKNHYSRKISRELGLNHSRSRGRSFGLWDGRRLVFQSLHLPWNQTNPSPFLTSLGLMARYGRSLILLKSLVKKTLDSFLKIYDKQEAGESFETAEELWSALGLFHLTQETLGEELRLHGLSDKLLRELVGAVNRVNYNQNNSLNALAGMVSLCPLVAGSVFAIQEGNAALPEAMIRSSADFLNLKTRITRVTINSTSSDRRYVLWSGDKEVGGFDALVLATPLELATIEFFRIRPDGEEELKLDDLSNIDFRTTHSTFVHGTLNASRLTGVEKSLWMSRMVRGRGRVPDSIYATEDSQDFFTSISHYGHEIYKIFSPRRLMKAEIDQLFTVYKVLEEKEWKAYPHFHPPETLQSFRPIADERIYYVNAIEKAVSAVEVSAIGGRNVALMLCRDVFPSKCPKQRDPREEL